MMFANRAMMDAFSRIGQIVLGTGVKWSSKSSIGRKLKAQALSEGVEESLQELVGIFAEHLGASWNGEQTSFLKALQSFEGKDIKRLGRAGLGGLVGGVVAGGASQLASPAIGVGVRAIDEGQRAILRGRLGESGMGGLFGQGPTSAGHWCF